MIEYPPGADVATGESRSVPVRPDVQETSPVPFVGCASLSFLREIIFLIFHASLVSAVGWARWILRKGRWMLSG